MNEWVINAVLSLGVGVITFFLKRTMNQVDKQEEAIQQIKNNYVLSENHERDIDACRREIKEIRQNCLTKEDFLREISKIDRKMDWITDRMIDEFKKGRGV